MCRIKEINELLELKKNLADIQNMVDTALDKTFGQNARKVKYVKKETPKKLTLDDCLDNIAKKLEMSDEQVSNFMNGVLEIHPIAAAQMLIKSASEIINQRYDDNIKQYDKVYAISTLNSSIIALTPNQIVNYNTISAFRTLSDAAEAKRALQKLLNEIFSQEEK